MTSTLNSVSRAPVALFVYNRPDHTRQTLAALRANTLANETALYIFVDAPRCEAARAAHEEVLGCVRDVQGFASVTLIMRERNFGLAQSIIDGVGMLCAKEGRVIVLEDDLVTSPYFLRYMNDALDGYADESKVMSVCGYMYPVEINSQVDTLFLRAPHSWGWATWQDRWSLFQTDGAVLLRELEFRRLCSELDANGPHNYTRMLKDQIAGINDSWFVRWYAASLLGDRISLYPIRSLVSNIGIDGSGVHCADWRFDPFKVSLSDDCIRVDVQKATICKSSDATLVSYYRRVSLLRYVNFVYRQLSRMMPVQGRN